MEKFNELKVERKDVKADSDRLHSLEERRKFKRKLLITDF